MGTDVYQVESNVGTIPGKLLSEYVYRWRHRHNNSLLKNYTGSGLKSTRRPGRTIG